MDDWVPHLSRLRDCIHGPHTKAKYHLKVANLRHNNNWDFQQLSIELPPDIQTIIRDMVIDDDSRELDTVAWSLTPKGKFTTSTAYSYIHN